MAATCKPMCSSFLREAAAYYCVRRSLTRHITRWLCAYLDMVQEATALRKLLKTPEGRAQVAQQMVEPIKASLLFHVTHQRFGYLAQERASVSPD